MEMNAEEDRLMILRQENLLKSYSWTRRLIISVLIIYPAIAFYSFWLIRRYLREKEIFEQQLQDTNLQLSNTSNKLDLSNQDLAASNEELQTSNEELAATTEEYQAAHDSAIEANKKLEELNISLEAKIEERILELKERNEALQRINNDLDDFVYTAAHDLKSPTNTLEGLVEILTIQLQDKAGDDERQTLSLMTASTTRLKRIIKELTEILRVQKEEGLPKQIIRFEDVLNEIEEDISSLIAQVKPQIITDWQVKEILYPLKHLRSILYNLLSNAVKYHDPNKMPAIRISSYTTLNSEDKMQTWLRIEDNGLGMEPRHLGQLFTMFKRFHDHVEGSGIGLYTIKRIIENNGGQIEVESELGKGTRFTILLDRLK